MIKPSAALLAAALAWPGVAMAQDAIETVTVTGDAAHLIETEPDSDFLGIAKSLIDTPRAVTVVSDTTLDRYGITGVDAFTAISPSAYTASYYGVEGAVNLRGTLAENYFRGFKRVEDRGTYTTPLGDAASIEILRGPPSPIYGAGKVGGLLNFIPKTEDIDATDIEGDVTATYGSYSKRNVTDGIGIPVDLGFVQGGIHAYGELDDSYSFYRGIHPSHQLLELSADFDLSPGWSVSGDYMYFHSNGDVQTPGWNRLTQDLVDTRTYITGRNTSLTDADGNGRLTLNEFGGDPYTFDPAFRPLTIAYPGCGTCTDAAHMLDVGVGTVTLDPRTIYIAKGVDFSNTVTHTGFLQFADALSAADALKFQLFFDSLANDRFVSYGFPGSYRTALGEARFSYDFSFVAGGVAATNVAGASYRYVSAIGKESFNSGVIALDRRDISQGPAPNDIIDSPFNVDPVGTVGLGWENDVRSVTRDAGLFETSDFAWNGFDLILGGRYDGYDVHSVDLGVLPDEPPGSTGAKGSLTYSASINYKAPFGLVPYATHAKSSAIEIGQASQVLTSLLANDSWLSDSGLNEAGVKFAFLNDHLVGSLAYYVQARTQLQQGGGVTTIQDTHANGEELELRYVASANLNFTLAADMQHTLVKGPDHSFVYLPARTAGVSPVDGFGGSYVTYDFSTLPGRAGNYEDTLVPHAVVSPYATYTSDPFSWGVTGASFGGSYVTQTAQTVPDPIIFHPYFTLNASVFVATGQWEVDFNVDNLTDKLYFTPDADTYSNLAALPSIGREWRLTLKRAF